MSKRRSATRQQNLNIDHLANLLKARVRIIDGESWVPVRDLKEVINHIVGGAK